VKGNQTLNRKKRKPTYPFESRRIPSENGLGGRIAGEKGGRRGIRGVSREKKDVLFLRKKKEFDASVEDANARRVTEGKKKEWLFREGKRVENVNLKAELLV